MRTVHSGSIAAHARPARLLLALFISVCCRTGQSAQEQVQNLSNQIPPLAVVVDDTRAGWGQVTPYASDPSGDNGGAGRIDWNTLSLAHDCDELYVRYRVADGPAFNPEGFRYNLLVDVDKNPATGYRGVGSWLSVGADVLIQGGPDKVTTFEFTGGTAQEAWGWREIRLYPVDDRPLPDGGRDIEFRTSLADLNVFGDGVSSFDWVAWADHTSGVMDIYPDAGFDTYSLAYVPIVAGSASPERGFAEATETTASKYTPVDLGTLQCYRNNEAVSVIHRYFYLETFVDGDISDQYLDLMQADFDTVRQAGLKVIPRFAYSQSSGPGLTPPMVTHPNNESWLTWTNCPRCSRETAM